MDIPIPLVVIIVFVIVFASLFFVYKFGIKEKSYEEALAEQRQQTNALLGARPKPKEKKAKKAKKPKEKHVSSADTEKSEESEGVANTASEPEASQLKLHVEFKEPELIEKPVKETPAPPVKKEEKQEIVKEKHNKTKQNVTVDHQEPQKSTKKIAKHQAASEQPPVQEVAEREEILESVVLPKPNGLVMNTGKEKKKKKSEFNTLQQLAADKQGVNLTNLLNLVRKADLTRSEVQILIDLLLNKQHEAPSVEDWSEGKSDPVQKLKKQLAEREKALQEEQQALTSIQSKLRDIRAEHNAEKSQFQQRIRALEEALQNKQLEIQAQNNRLHGQTQKVQQLQAQLNDEIINGHKLREEQSALLVQRQQLECRLAQTQETDGIIAQLRNEIQELKNQHNQLGMDLHALGEQNMAEKEGHQNFIAQLKHQLAAVKNDAAAFQQELEQKNDLLRQQEENRLNLEHQLDLAYHQEADLQAEISNLKSACQQNADKLQRLEHLEIKVRDDAVAFQQQKDESERLINQLRNDLEEAQAEKEKLQVAQANGTIEQDAEQKIKYLNSLNEIASLQSQLEQSEAKYVAELDVAKATINKLESDLSQQKGKNNELRKKNWKVMEALNAAESRTKITSPPVNVDEILSKAIKDEQVNNRNFIQRLFPELMEQLSNVSQEQWQVEFEKIIQGHIDGLQQKQQQVKSNEQSGEVAKLQAQILNYKTIIDDTEGMLNKLQKHIEQEEIDWRNQLKAKEAEIETLKEKQIKQLQIKLSTLELQLEKEKEEKQIIAQELTVFRNKNASQVDSAAVIEKLSEEVNNLKERLQSEQKRNGDVEHQQEESIVPVKTQNSTNGPSLIQQNFSYSSSADSSLTEVAVKPKNKKKKKKGSGN